VKPPLFRHAIKSNLPGFRIDSYHFVADAFTLGNQNAINTAARPSTDLETDKRTEADFHSRGGCPFLFVRPIRAAVR
jgi:hypothetical protein